ncbi:unnamed protein product [Periconia digitata]|uniref:Uncharacterized protein n=1 Tax=Periconia digitata TaxID=1303443 RepID=A0A9W4UM84_9PLEO|nr:unnamed protein product [Periconia digitata]
MAPRERWVLGMDQLRWVWKRAIIVEVISPDLMSLLIDFIDFKTEFSCSYTQRCDHSGELTRDFRGRSCTEGAIKGDGTSEMGVSCAGVSLVLADGGAKDEKVTGRDIDCRAVGATGSSALITLWSYVWFRRRA